MKLGARQREIFSHAFMAGLDLAGCVKRSEVNNAIEEAVKRYERPSVQKKLNNQQFVIELLAVKPFVTASYLTGILESQRAATNALYELHRKRIIKKAGRGRWVLNNIEVVK